MRTTKNASISAYMFFAAGIGFFAAAFIGQQVAFYGVGAVFLALGATQYRRTKSDK